MLSIVSEAAALELEGAARAEHVLAVATVAALLAVGAVRRLRTRRPARGAR